ncbi:Lethal(2) giant larvae sro7 [Marasmius crinis-equi]|uniref:Lethal(2) giant larvae sro7 n=1 Tax=Marasmius crinis-equi TaxID=585013 RepID=A0ABR3FMT1_9AGAR
MAFFKQREPVLDLSGDLRDAPEWKPGPLRVFEYALNVTALAIEPISGLLAVGTGHGSIHLFGRPGVECKILLPDAHKVTSLHLPSSAYKVVCLDDHNQLHVWDLLTSGPPKYLASARFAQANSLAVSPYHNHAFIALQSGEIRTYDLACLRKSPYTVPNLWNLYEEKMAASGMPEITTPTSGIALDIVAHPRNLNLLFIVYGGGVILSDLSERNTSRVYELVLCPGAPGGGGYGAPDILMPRRPEATCIAVHPAGHFFAVGYADGCIAFWAVDDEDQPLMVRTMDEVDVNVVDATRLEEHMNKGASSGPSQREPIFKLSWCSFPNSPDPRGGETALVVLGGSQPEDSAGVTTFWLPAFNPPTPAVPSTSSDIDPIIRKAMRNAVTTTKSYFYYVEGLVQDYLLVPRESPQFSGTHDPFAILIIREGPRRTRITDGFQFPPPSFTAADTQPENTQEESGSNAETEGEPQDPLADLQSTLQSMQLSDDAASLLLPGFLSNGATGLLDGQLRRLPRDAYQNLVQESLDPDRNLKLRAGFAYLGAQTHSEAGLSKYQPPRILITSHLNLTVQLWDISSSLLANARPNPIEYEFPNHLPRLSIDLNSVLSDARVAPKLERSANRMIDIVDFTTESLDCAITLSSGEVILYRLRSHYEECPENLSDKELLSLSHLSNLSGPKFVPYLLADAKKGNISSISLADAGLLAVAYQNGSLIVVDTKRPQVILRSDEKAKRHSFGVHLGHSEADRFQSLLWTVCPTSSDPQARLRLIAAKTSGSSFVFTLEQSPADSSWKVSEEPVKIDTPNHPVPGGLFVIDAKNGARCLAVRRRLHSPSEGRVLFVAAGMKGVRCSLDVTGDRLGRAEWNSKMGQVLSTQIVEKLGSFALVAFTANNEALAYSLPELEFFHDLALPPIRQPLPLSVDETGDFIGWSLNPESGSIQEATYGTLFDFRRINTSADVVFSTSKPVVPAPPQPVSVSPESYLGSWFKLYNQTMTGEQADALFGGPDRPIPQPQNLVAASTQETSSPSPSPRIANQAASTQQTLYSRLTSALEERGQMLGDLEDRFNSLEQGSRSMANQASVVRLVFWRRNLKWFLQAKRLAAEQTAKSWFKFH